MTSKLKKKIWITYDIVNGVTTLIAVQNKVVFSVRVFYADNFQEKFTEAISPVALKCRKLEEIDPVNITWQD